MNNNISFKEAINLISNLVIQTKHTEKIAFNSSVGRILSSDILAKEDMPRFPTSNMDGYAFSYTDLEILINEGLEIDSINKAGNAKITNIKRGFCVKTMTGAIMPQGADSLVIVEMVHIKNNRIFLNNKLDSTLLKPYKFIRKVADSYKKGDVLLHRGRVINPLDIGVLAQNNNVFVEVYQKPRVAILSSGDEIIEVGEIPQMQNYIYSSNNHILAAICQALGCESSVHKILKDDKKIIRDSIRNALNSFDIVITTGGMSKGDFDFTKDIVNEFGESIFSGVNIKPGKVISYIKCDNAKHIFALPGNPISSVVSFLLFGRLILQKMLSISPNIPLKKATLLNDVKRSDERLEFGLSNLYINDGKYEVEIKQKAHSYMLNHLNGAMSILKDDSYKKGSIIDIIIFDELLKL